MCVSVQTNPLTHVVALYNDARMANEITAKQIEDAALAARVTITDVLKRSGVSRGSFYRFRRGDGNMLQLTKERMLDAVAELRLEKLKGE